MIPCECSVSCHKNCVDKGIDHPKQNPFCHNKLCHKCKITIVSVSTHTGKCGRCGLTICSNCEWYSDFSEHIYEFCNDCDKLN